MLALALPWLASLGVGLHLLLSEHHHEHEAAAPGTLLVVAGDDHSHALPAPEHHAVLSERAARLTPAVQVTAVLAEPVLSPPPRPAPSWLTDSAFLSAKSPPIYRLGVLRL